ncbi:MAG: HAD-IA family hydrolase [Acetobacteraceae bacterium]|jgi:2-haloalkanoic acid dehalogenase type II|nr:HAD-IA family hydrolase [Acetobacteraceae bacterium]
MLDLRRFKALTFDCYGTLIDWEKGILAFLSPLCRAEGNDWSDAHILEAFADVEHRQQEADPAALYPEILARSFLDLADRLGLRRDLETARAFGASIPAWPPFPDTPAAFAELAGRFTLGILSNVDRANLAASIAAIGTAPHFTVTAEDVGHYKPHHAHFEAALAHLAAEGIGKAEVLHVAQSKFHDIAPARALGIPCVWVNRRARRTGTGATPEAHVVPDWSVTSLAEIAAIARTEFHGR